MQQTSEQHAGTAVIVGAGPGIGAAVARRFAREHLPVALIARRAQAVAAVADTITSDVPVLRLTADATDEPSLRDALDTAARELGPPAVVVYNAAVVRADRPDELSAREHLNAWSVNVGGALSTAAHVLPAMAQRGAGTFVITGGMPEPDPQYTSLSLGKVGVRALTTLLDQQYRPAGIHVATVTVAGAVAPGTRFDPDDIAEHYWRLHTQPRDQWQREVVHG